MLKPYFCESTEIIEIGVDEVGRGPLFGRVYVSAVVLPKNDPNFNYSLLKDSKRFHSKNKLLKVAEYIKTNALAYTIQYADEKEIDKINILQATQQIMHKAVLDIIQKLKPAKLENIKLLIDGNYFIPFSIENKTIPYITIEGGDNIYCSIAAASIIAKVERDNYIRDLCVDYPELDEKYSLSTNKGYGAKKHLDGIHKYGITKWHRKTFGICKTAHIEK